MAVVKLIVRTASTPEKARIIVKRGVRLLDKAKPGWEKKIKLERFDLGNEKYCVLGYVYRDFFQGLYTLATDAKKAKVAGTKKDRSNYYGDGRIRDYYYGFNFHSGKHGEYLSQEWKRVIARRQKRHANV